MSKEHRKVCTTWKYNEHILIIVSGINGYVSISTFASLVGISLGICQFGSSIKRLCNNYSNQRI